MTKSDYQKAYEAAEKELTELLQLQEQIEKRILGLRQTVSSLGVLCKQEDVDFEPGTLAGTLIDRMGITYDVLAIVNGARMGLTPTQVRDRLKEIGYDLTKYSNPLSTIHVVLNRLEESRKIRSRTLQGKKYYVRIIPSGGSTPTSSVEESRNIPPLKVTIARPSEIRGLNLPKMGEDKD
jgi:hypothetical protein